MEVRAKKALGQHFLTDQSVAKRIVGALKGSAAEVCGAAEANGKCLKQKICIIEVILHFLCKYYSCSALS